MNAFVEQLRTLDPNDPGRWPGAYRLGAIGLILLIAIGLASWFLAWKPKKPELDQARSQEQVLLQTLGEKARKAANLEAYKVQLKEMEQSFGAMLRQLPNKTEVPNLLVDISQQGTAAGLEQTLFQPSAQVNKDFYAELPIRIKLQGNFHSIGNFVSGIAALPRIVTLHDISIKPVDKGGPDDLLLEVTAKTYRYLDEEEQAAVEAAKPKPGAKRAGAST
jgi:type IV pilus assembly protein PilO